MNSIASVVVHVWVYVVCVKTKWQNSASNYKNMHIVRAVLFGGAAAWCSTWCFSNVQHKMMNDPLNLCKKTNKIHTLFRCLFFSEWMDETVHLFLFFLVCSVCSFFGCYLVCRYDFYYSLVDYIVVFNRTDCESISFKQKNRLIKWQYGYTMAFRRHKN